MKTINLNSESECAIVLIPQYSESNNDRCFLLILERELVPAACFIQLTSKTERISKRRKKGRLAEFIVSKEYVRPLIATMLIVFKKNSLTETLTSTMLVISSFHKVITIPGEERTCG